jgi:hypothetical protein
MMDLDTYLMIEITALEDNNNDMVCDRDRFGVSTNKKRDCDVVLYFYTRNNYQTHKKGVTEDRGIRTIWNEFDKGLSNALEPRTFLE